MKADIITIGSFVGGKPYGFVMAGGECCIEIDENGVMTYGGWTIEELKNISEGGLEEK